MKIRRLIMTLAVLAGTVGGLSPVGAPAYADGCDNPIRLYFWYGRRIQTGQNSPTTGREIVVTASNPINIDSRFVPCTLLDGSGVTIKKPVWPGSTSVSGRADNSLCRNVNGDIQGLGVNDRRLWTAPTDVLGNCDAAVGTTGAATVLIAMDPTQLGDISAWTDDVGFGGRVIYTTVDR